MSSYNSPASKARIDAAWALALRLQQFGYAEIASGVTASMQFTMHFVKGWERDGKIRVIAPGRKGSERKLYEVVPQSEQKPTPVIGDATDQMWFVMRKFGSFSPVDLVAHCSVLVPIEEARAYCRTLLATRYLKVVQKAVPNRKEAIYRLANQTGPKAPRKRRVTCIVDDNLGTVLPMLEEGQ